MTLSGYFISNGFEPAYYSLLLTYFSVSYRMTRQVVNNFDLKYNPDINTAI